MFSQLLVILLILRCTIFLFCFLLALWESQRNFYFTLGLLVLWRPTPVSALIHAATMVTAGIYLLIRVSWIFIAHLGAFVAFFAASMALVNKDLKKDYCIFYIITTWVYVCCSRAWVLLSCIVSSSYTRIFLSLYYFLALEI